MDAAIQPSAAAASALPTPALRPVWKQRRPRPSAADDGATSDGSTATGSALGGVPGWLLVGLGVLLLAVVGFDLIVGVRSHTAEKQRTSSSAAISTALDQAPTQAETAAVRMLGYDYQTLRQDADAAKRFMTSGYAAKFQNTVDRLVSAPARKRQAHVEADVKASGVVSATASRVQVMLFVDQTSQTTLQSQPQTYLNRVVVTMVKSGGKWLVDDVTAL